MDATENYGQELAYDLRQKYAEIVGVVLMKISLARENNDFQRWFNYLDDLHTEINQKLKKEEKKKIRLQEVLKKRIL